MKSIINLKRYEIISRAITRDILRASILPGEKLPGERILADRFEANLQTVNKAISNLVSSGHLRRNGSIGPYVSNDIDIEALRRNFKATVALIYDGSMNTIANAGRTLARLTYNLQIALSNLGFNWIIISQQDGMDYRNYLDVTDACITIGNVDSTLVKYITRVGIPTVTYNRNYSAMGIGSVILDTGPIARVLKEMYSMGHRSFLFVSDTPPNPYTVSFDRYSVFKSTTEELQVSKDDDILIVPEMAITNSLLPDYVKKRFQNCDFVFVTNSHIGVHLLTGIIKAGIKIPQELGIIGFDDTITARYCRIPLSTFSYDFTSVCDITIRKLHNLLFGIEEELLSVVETRFVSRESTRRYLIGSDD